MRATASSDRTTRRSAAEDPGDRDRDGGTTGRRSSAEDPGDGDRDGGTTSRRAAAPRRASGHSAAERAGNGGPASRRRQRPARAHKAAMTVAQQIVDEMGRRDNEPGTKLPTEKEMLAEYRVGRGTLRESLRFLEMNGVITMKPGPGGGPIVGEPDSRDLAGTLGLFLQLHNTPFRAIVEARRLLEPIMAGLAAKNGSEEALAEIARSVDEMEANVADEERFLEANEIFHEAVAWASGNTVFALFISSLHWITDGSGLGVDYPERRRNTVLKAHRRICDALLARDADEATRRMAVHLENFEIYVSQGYPSVYASRLRWSDVAP